MKLYLILLSFLLLGCSTNKKLTREQYLNLTNREFKNTTKETLIKNAIQVITLMDPDDVTFHHTDSGFVAERNYLIYAVLAAERGKVVWNFSTKEMKDGSIKASLAVQRMASTFGGTVTTGGEAAATGYGSTQAFTASSVPYVYFWERIAFLNGNSDSWPTCNELKDRMNREKEKLFGDEFEICGLTDDYLPGNLSDEILMKKIDSLSSYYRKKDLLRKINTSREKAGEKPLEYEIIRGSGEY